MSRFFSAQSLRPLRLCGEQGFKYIHRREAENAAEAQRTTNYAMAHNGAR
jgi:hypothetical protein